MIRFTPSVLFALAVTVTAPAQNDDELFDGAVVALPPFYVEPADGATWLRATLPGFELLTTHDRTFARQFVRFYVNQSRALEEFVPARFLWHPHLPETYIVVDQRSKRSDPDEFVSLMINENRAAQPDRRGRHRFRPNLRLTSADSAITFAFMNKDDLDESRPPAPDPRSFVQRGVPTPGSGRAVIPGFRFSTNRLAHQLRHRAPALPVWFIAGLVRVYDRCDFRPDRIFVGASPTLEADPPDPATGETPPIMSLDEVLVQPAPTDEAALQRWTARSELFVRWCLFSSRKSNRSALWTYLDRVILETPGEALFEKCFGLSFAAAEKQIDRFYHNRATKRLVHRVPRGDRAPSPPIERANRSDVARILGEWERLETVHVERHFPELLDSYRERARQTILKARHTEAGSPALDATAGLLELAAGNFAEARTNLENAIAGGTTRPLAYLTLAQLRSQPGERDASPAAVDTEPVVSLLLQAHQESPAIPRVYSDLAEIWATAEAPLTRDEIGVLAAGVRGFPRNIPLVTKMVLLQAGRGQFRSSQQILDYAQVRAAHQGDADTLRDLSLRLQAMIPVE